RAPHAGAGRPRRSRAGRARPPQKRSPKRPPKRRERGPALRARTAWSRASDPRVRLPGGAPRAASLAEAGRVVVRGGLLLQLRVVGVELEGARQEDLFRLDDLRIGEAALHGADRLTRLVIVEADALGAELGIDHVDLVALADGLVGTLRLACAAVDAIFGD